MKELTLEVLRNGGHVERLDNSPRPKLRAGRTVYTLLPQPKPIDYRKRPNEPVE